jgi:hypothetical protein
MKFKEVIIEEAPFKCKLKIKKSIEELLFITDKGAYKVQPTLAPELPKNPIPIKKNKKDKLNSHKEAKFNLGKAISVDPICRGIKIFPKAPINIGIIKKNH